MRSYRPGSMIAAAALTALGACSGPSPARLAAEADAEAAAYIPCREAPQMFFAGDRPALGCALSGQASLLDKHPMVVAFGPGNIVGENARLTVGMPANDGQRYCIAQISVMDIIEAGQPSVAPFTVYTVVDSRDKAAAIRTGQQMALLPATDDWRQLPEDLSCRDGIEARSRLAFSRVVAALGEKTGTPV